MITSTCLMILNIRCEGARLPFFVLIFVQASP